jgi:hypothetical protein
MDSIDMRKMIDKVKSFNSLNESKIDYLVKKR